MTDEQLKKIWQASDERMQQINLHSINSNHMNERIKKFEKTITTRNNKEIAVAIGLIITYSIFAYVKSEPLTRIGAILLLFYSFHVLYQLRKTAAKQPSFDVMANLKEQLVAYQAYVLEEQKLYKNVLYWYLLPMLPGLILFLIGSGINLIASIIYFGVIVPIGFTLVYYFNQKAVKKLTKPLLADIAKTLKSLEEIR